MTLLQPGNALQPAVAPDALVSGWEALLGPRDLERLELLHRAGAEVVWSCKALSRDDGGQLAHHMVEVRQRQTGKPQAGQRPGWVRLGHAGPADFRYGHRDQLVHKMTRSVLGQALAALNISVADPSTDLS